MKTTAFGIPMLALGFLVSACGGSVTVTDVRYLETDTTIDSATPGPLASLDRLHVMRSPDAEARTLVKLPTGYGTSTSNLSRGGEPAARDLLWLAPFYVFTEILAELFDCKTKVMTAANLTDARLVLEPLGGTTSAAPTPIPDPSASPVPLGTAPIQLAKIDQPWWQDADWSFGHHFSDQGRWSTPGGSASTDFTTVTGVWYSRDARTTLEFDITEYARTLIQSEGASVHFGFLVRAPQESATVDESLHSVQTLQSNRGPRVISTYTGECDTAGISFGRHEVTRYLSAR